MVEALRPLLPDDKELDEERRYNLARGVRVATSPHDIYSSMLYTRCGASIKLIARPGENMCLMYYTAAAE